MLRTIAVCMVGLVAGCKGKSAATSGGSGGNTGSAVAAVTDDAGAAETKPPPPAVAVLLVDDDNDDVGLAMAFDKKVPLLPAISADGQWLATFESGASEPMPVLPWEVQLDHLTENKREHIELVDDKMLETADLGDNNEWKNPPLDELHERAAAVTKRLADGGFSSLSQVELSITPNGDPLPTKIGSATLETDERDDHLDLSLVDGAGKALHRETLKSFKQGKWDTGVGEAACQYRPSLSSVYQDSQKRHLYITIVHRFHEMCGPTDNVVLAWDLPAPSAADAAAAADLDAVTKLFAGEIDALHKKDVSQLTADAHLYSQKGAGTPAKPGFEIDRPELSWGGHEDRAVEVAMSRDGKSAWASGVAGIVLSTKNANRRGYDLRVTSVMVKTPAGWKIAATALTEPVDDATVNEAAKKGAWAHTTFQGAAGDASLQAAFAKLTTAGIDATAAANPDLITLGSAMDERFVGGAKIAKAWNGAWKGKVKVTSTVAGLAPSGTTGWVAATVDLAKKGYKVPFYVVCVFDKTASGEWTLVHMHLAV